MKGIALLGFMFLEKFSDTLILAKNRKTGEKVAIKSWDEKDVLGVRETSIWKNYFSDYFVESKIIEGKRILVRKWIDGEPLSKVFENNKGMSPDRAANVLLRLMDMVEDFHTRTNMFIGDLMPQNIIIKMGTPKLVDFETCSVPGDDETEFFSKKKTMNFGTPFFCAPEIIMGEGTLKSDVYSLGMIFLYLLVGEPNRGKISELESKYAFFIRRATDITANNRFESILDMKTNLQSILEKTPVISENHEVKRNLHVIPKLVNGYRKNIIYIRDKPSFVSELAYVFSQYYGLKTCAVEICDWDGGRLSYYIGKEENSFSNGSELMCSEGETEYLRRNTTKYSSTSFNDNLYISTCKIDMYEYMNDENMRDFMSFAYDNFDITLVCDSLSDTSPNHLQFIRFCDQYILPTNTDIDESNRAISYAEFLFRANKISTNKIKVVGFEYDSKISSDVELTAQKNGVKFLGYIGKNDERRRILNFECDFFATKMNDEEINAYCEIIDKII